MSFSLKAKSRALSWIAPCAKSIRDAICQSASACQWLLIWRCPHSQKTLGASIDFKAAHKQVQVRPEEHGLLLFAFQGKLYHYRVRHFGGRFSAFWWQRTGAFLLRQVHGLLAWKPDKAFLFVDDLLCALFRDSAPDMFSLVVLFFCAIAAPILWKKAQFQDSLVWRSTSLTTPFSSCLLN